MTRWTKAFLLATLHAGLLGLCLGGVPRAVQRGDEFVALAKLVGAIVSLEMVIYYDRICTKAEE